MQEIYYIVLPVGYTYESLELFMLILHNPFWKLPSHLSNPHHG